MGVRSRSVLPAYLLVQVLLVAGLGLADLWPGSVRERALVNTTVQAVAAALAAVVIFWRSGAYPQTRRTWRWAGWAATFWCAGTSWLAVQFAVTGEMARPSPADGLFVVAVVFAVGAALLFPSLPQGRRGRLRIAIDGSVLAASVLYLVLDRLGPLIDGQDDAFTLAYPIADCLVITLLLSAAMRSPRRLLPSLGTAVLGLLVLSVTNVETFRLSLEGASTLSTPENAGFALGLALVGLGAMLQSDLGTHRVEEGLVQQGQRLLPYLFVPIVLLMVAISEAAPRGLQLLLLVLLAALLLARQVLVVEENASLARDVVRRSRGYEALVQGSSELVLVLRPSGRILYASPSVEKSLGLRRGTGPTLHDLVGDEDAPALRRAIDSASSDGSTACTFRVEGTGGTMVLEARLTDRTGDPAVQGIVVNARDVTAQALAQSALQESEQRYRRIVETAQEGIWVTDAQGITRFVNEHAARLLDLKLDELAGRPTTEILFPLMDEAGRAEIQRRLAERRTGEISSYEFSFVRPDGTPIHTQITASPLLDPEGRFDGSLTMMTDITGRVVAEAQLRQDARSDPLTGLANRALLSSQAAAALAAYDPVRPPALIYCDLDGFKTVNDAWGHSAGDELLRKVAERLKTLETPDMTIARLGGDEFAILLMSLPDRQVEAFAEQLLAALREPYSLGERVHHVDLSIGIAIAEPDDQVESLLRNADLAMYQAKADGRGRYRRYETAMHAAVTARIEMEHDLRHALARDQLRLHYQPVLDLRTGECVGAEALLRWLHPVRGEVAPDTFLPTAEGSDLILDIGTWVLERALDDAALWSTGERPLVLSVNIAPQQLMDPRHVDRIGSILSSAVLPPTQVLLEVTEHSLLAGERPRQSLRALRATGARLALDDFGTGYSSIAHLRDHPVDVLKLDRSYVSQAGNPNPSGRLALAILDMSRQLGISCTAEGIETHEQARVLAAGGCAHAQGFLFAKPMPQASLLTWLATSGRGLLGQRQPESGPVASAQT